MPATGARRGHLVYHWKHGWIPLDHFAALSKAHHSKSGAVKVMQKHGIDVPKGYSSDHKGKPSAIEAHRAETQRSQEAHLRASAVAHGLQKSQPSAGDISDAAAIWKRQNPGKKIAGNEREVSRLAERLAEQKFVLRNTTGDTAAQHAAERERIKKAAATVGGSQSMLNRLVAEKHASPAPTHSAGMDPHAIRATQLREAAAKKRAEAERIAGSVGAPDRAGAMLRAKDSMRMNARMDSGLRRFTERQREAKALESKAHLAEGRSKTAAEKQAAADLAATPSKLSPGDLIQHKGSAHMVTKVNKTTVSVPSIVGGSWEDKLPISGISKHVPIAQMKDSNLQAMYAKAASHPKLRATYAAELKRRGLLTGN